MSEILSIFQNYSKVDPAKLKKAQDIGTLVHDAIERHFKGEFVVTAMPWKPYFESFLRWEKTHSLKPLVIEERYYDDNLMITGRIDLLCELDGMIVLVDFKTGSWAHPEIWKLQATFYRGLLQWGKEIQNPNHFLYIQLKPDGSEPVLFPMEFEIEDLIVTMGALRAYRWFQKQKTPAMEQG